MGRAIIEGDVEYARVLLRVGTADAKIVQALVYRGLATEIAERLVEDSKSGKQVEAQEPDLPSAEPTRVQQNEIPIVQHVPPKKHANTPVRGVRLWVILPPLLALALALSGAWWWKAAEARHAREFAEQQAAAEAQSRRVAEATERVPLVVAQANDCWRSGKVAAGLKLVDELLSLVDAPELQDAKVNLLIKGGRLNEAYQVLLQLLKKQPEDARLHNTAGVLAEALGRVSEASSQYGEACRLEPENKAYQFAWAKTCLKTGASVQVQQAVTIFKKLLEDDPKATTPWLDCALALYKGGQKSESIKLLSEAASRFPDQGIFPFALAKTYDWMGTENADSAKLNLAASYYLESLRLRPSKNSVAAKRYLEITGNPVPPEYEGSPPLEELQLVKEGNAFFAYVYINGRSARFRVDSGADTAAVSAASAAQFNLVPKKAEIVRTAGGLARSYLAYGDITLGKHTLHQAPIGIVSASLGRGCDGLLGADTLTRLNAKLDTARAVLIIQGEQPEALFGN